MKKTFSEKKHSHIRVFQHFLCNLETVNTQRSLVCVCVILCGGLVQVSPQFESTCAGLNTAGKLSLFNAQIVPTEGRLFSAR